MLLGKRLGQQHPMILRTESSRPHCKEGHVFLAQPLISVANELSSLVTARLSLRA